MAKARRLKVFQARLGFYDTVVAVPSQAAALRAWGVHQNLFADGQARIADDRTAVAAAEAHPGKVLKRPAGGRGRFEIDPTTLPEPPPAPRRKSAAIGRKPPASAAKPAADHAALNAAEAVLRDLESARIAEEAVLAKRQDALDAEKSAAQQRYVQRRKAAVAAVTSARKRFRKAVGRE
ncbi:MAG TPA: cell envelope biogenesis protein TolA [Caulobacteraceae bacterium]|nr:cell envelope biogenesis protein TolA [Caulobacteraceae bacterium]